MSNQNLDAGLTQGGDMKWVKKPRIAVNATWDGERFRRRDNDFPIAGLVYVQKNVAHRLDGRVLFWHAGRTYEGWVK